jgi:uncharacterized protein
MKVLITGATGLVGTELVSLLLKNGVYINYLTTSEDKIQKEEKYKGFLWNPQTAEIDESCIDEVDAVINLAGAPISKRWTASYKEEILDSRIISTNLLLRLLKNKPNTVQQFICASAIGVYPDGLERIYNEESTDRDNTFLGQVVQKWEEAADQIQNLTNIKVAKIRTGLVLSGKGGMLKELSGPVGFGIGSAFGSGKQMQSWIHIRDLVGIYHFVLMHGLEGVFNAVAPYPADQNTLIRTVAKVMDKTYFMPNIPKFVMKTVLGEMHTLLYTSQNISAKKIIGEGYQFKFLSLEKAIRDALRS